MKIVIDSPLNIGDCIYRIEFYNSSQIIMDLHIFLPKKKQLGL